MFVLICLGLSSASRADEPKIAKEKRSKLLSEIEFEMMVIKWQPFIQGNRGLVFDDRPEPRSVQAEVWRKKAAADPDDAESRSRLFESPETDEEALRCKDEAVAIYRRHLAAKPDDAVTMAWLAMLLRDTDEGKELAEKAAQLAPERWEPRLALARVLALRCIKGCFVGLKNLPPGGVDMMRLEEALRTQGGSDERSGVIFKNGNQAIESAKKSMELAPAGVTEPYLRFLGTRVELSMIMNNLHAVRGEPFPSIDEADRESLMWLGKGVDICRDRPEALGALGLLAFQNVMAEGSRKRLSDSEKAERQKQVLAPCMEKLRDLCDHRDPLVAAPACEAYSALIVFVQMLGGKPSSSEELPTLLEKAVKLDPHRCLAWDLRLYLAMEAGVTGGDLQEARKDALALARERLKVIPSGRSHALVAYYLDGLDAVAEWRLALEKEADNAEYRVNLSAAILRYDDSSKGLDACMGELQKATEQGYAQNLWDQYQKLDKMRRRVFIVHQALSGNTDVARAAASALIELDPGDSHSIHLLDALKAW